jgi:hypothetical protein
MRVEGIFRAVLNASPSERESLDDRASSLQCYRLSAGSDQSVSDLARGDVCPAGGLRLGIINPLVPQAVNLAMPGKLLLKRSFCFDEAVSNGNCHRESSSGETNASANRTSTSNELRVSAATLFYGCARSATNLTRWSSEKRPGPHAIRESAIAAQVI